MRIFTRYFGYILLMSTLFRVIPIFSAIIYGESFALYLLSFFLSLLLGLFLLWIEKKIKIKESPLTLSQGLTLVALSFIVLPLIGAISFLPSFNYNYLNAAFESISGFTTTGLTLYDSLDGLPKSLLLWRAETQWMGGIGIIMFFLFIASRLKFHAGDTSGSKNASTSSLYQAQGFPQKLEPGLKKTSKHIFIIYGGYTLLGIFLLSISGMSLFESIAMTFTSLSTGGFTVSDNFYSNNFQLIVLSLLMILGSISFIVHNKLLQKKFKDFFRSYEKNSFLAFLIISIMITMLVFTDLKVVVFQLISAFTTTGYSITKIALLPHLFIVMIMLGMVVGGSIASTSGGIKISRVYTLLKMLPWSMRKLSSPPHAIIPFKVDGNQVEEENLLIISVFVFSFLFILVGGTIIFLLLGYNFFDSSFQITSALGTVGLQTMSLLPVPEIGKLVLITAMLLGRLEIFPLFILMRKIFKS